MKLLTKILLLCLSAMLIITSCKKDDTEPKKYTLTVAANPTIGGTVTGGGDYKSGEDVNLTATANSDYDFVNWTNGATEVSTDPNFTYTTTNQDVSLNANFTLKTYNLTLTVSPDNSGNVTGQGNYTAGQSVNITATPNAGYAFVNWTNGATVVSTNANFTYTATAQAVTLTANFEQLHYTLTVLESPTNSGVVTGGGSYHTGESVNLTATPNSGYAFVNWKKGTEVVSTNANFTYTTTAEDVTLTANFIKTYKLTLNNPFPAGSATVSGGGDYPVGTNVNITVTPSSAWTFINWHKLGGGEIISTQPIFTYTTTAEDVTLAVELDNLYVLTLNTNMANAGVLDGGGSYRRGTSVNLTATPSIGYTFVNWTKGGVEISTNATFSFTTESFDETLTANFTEKTYLITLGAQSHATIGAFYSIAQNTIYNQTDASNNQSAIDLICFYEHDVVNNRINDITLSSPGANITGIFGGGATDPSQWATKRLTLFTPPTSTITTTQFDALHQNDPAIQTYFNSGMTSSNKKAKLLAVDNIYAFKTQDNVYGLFKVTNVVNSADGLVEVVLKFRK